MTEEEKGLPRDEEELRKRFSEDQAGTLWQVLQAVYQVNQGIDKRIRAYLEEMCPKKYKELEKKEREELLIKLIAQKSGGEE